MEDKKIKIICRLTETLQYQQEIYVDNQLCTEQDEIIQAALAFLNAFEPEAELQSAEEELSIKEEFDSRHLVLVFRTSIHQMQNFSDVFMKNS